MTDERQQLLLENEKFVSGFDDVFKNNGHYLKPISIILFKFMSLNVDIIISKFR